MVYKLKIIYFQKLFNKIEIKEINNKENKKITKY